MVLVRKIKSDAGANNIISVYAIYTKYIKNYFRL